MVVWVKVYAVEVKMEVVWVGEVFAETLALLTRQHSAMKLVLLLCCHLEEAQSVVYI